MADSIYSPLPKDFFSIRLLRLSPAADATLPIHCKLVVYPLYSRPPEEQLYEALSYAWGTARNSQKIIIETDAHSCEVETTQNLHEALIQLRDPYFERILWVDALCIDQENDKEKAHQVGAMARIYGLAKRVVVWLGEEQDNSDLAFERLFEMALRRVPGTDENSEIASTSVDKSRNGPKFETSYSTSMHHTGHDNVSDVNVKAASLVPGLWAEKEATQKAKDRATRALLSRPYFRRIWVCSNTLKCLSRAAHYGCIMAEFWQILQELVAARHILFRCGDKEIKGDDFRAGLTNLKINIEDESGVFQRGIRAAVALLDYSSSCTNLKGQAHLNIQPLAELADMFYAHETTDRRDKIYALLGLCSDHELLQNIEPDYSKDWSDLFEEFGRFVFGSDSSIAASESHEMLVVRTQCFILGSISEILVKGSWDDSQVLWITASEPQRFLNSNYAWDARCKLRRSVSNI